MINPSRDVVYDAITNYYNQIKKHLIDSASPSTAMHLTECTECAIYKTASFALSQSQDSPAYCSIVSDLPCGQQLPDQALQSIRAELLLRLTLRNNYANPVEELLEARAPFIAFKSESSAQPNPTTDTKNSMQSLIHAYHKFLRETQHWVKSFDPLKASAIEEKSDTLPLWVMEKSRQTFEILNDFDFG